LQENGCSIYFARDPICDNHSLTYSPHEPEVVYGSKGRQEGD
jgi:hypothetical protein